MPDTRNPPKAGDRKYSNFFKSPVEMVHYVHDNEYYFRVLDNPLYRAQFYKNQSPWSSLLASKPE